MWSNEVCTAYFGRNYSPLLEDLPSLLITNAHPDAITPDSFRLLVPLRRAQEKFGSLDAFFSRLVRFVRDSDPTFLDMFQHEDDFAKDGAGMLELKPNFCGVGININAIIEWFLKRRERTASS